MPELLDLLIGGPVAADLHATTLPAGLTTRPSAATLAPASLPTACGAADSKFARIKDSVLIYVELCEHRHGPIDFLR